MKTTFDMVWEKYSKQKKITTFVRKAGYSTIAVAASIGLLLGAGTASPTFAEMIRQIPVIDSVFKLTGGDALQEAQEKGIVARVDQAVEDQGLKVTITEAIYDGSRITLGYILQSEEELTGNMAHQMEVRIDGKPIEFYTDGHDKPIDRKATASVLHLNMVKDLPETFQLDLKFTHFGETKGKWKFSIPITQNGVDNKVVVPMLSKGPVLLEKVNFTITATELTWRIPEGYDATEFEVFDEKGIQLELISGSEVNGTAKMIYEPVKKVPQSILIRSKDAKLEMNVPIN